LIVGADDSKFDENGLRLLYNVNYKTPERSELVKWLSSASSPAVVGLESKLVPFQELNLWVITIPPMFDLHETTRELITPNGKFNKNTVFMRQDEHTVPASVRDGITIQQLKHSYRQEIANPPAVWIGVISGGVVTFIISAAKIRETQLTSPISDNLIRITFTGVGVFFGAMIGYFAKQWNETRYDWRYLTLRQRIILVAFIFIMMVIFYFIYR
jgi:hypothetical protein